MKSENDNDEVLFNEVTYTLEVDDEVIEKVRTGEVTHISIDLNNYNYRDILEHSEGGLVLVTDELPDTFHGYNFYNGGVFPYAIKSALDFLVLSGDEDVCLTRIIDINPEPGTRFRFQGPGKSSIEDPNGDSCIWKIHFELVPLPEEPRTYLMRWNPSISSFKEKDYEACVGNLVHGMFRINWSIYEWQEARRGDLCYMLRTGDDKAGIVFFGQFISDPYPGDDWAGSNKRRMYVDMVCIDPMELGKKPHITLEKLQEAIPDFEWSKGHSGELLSEEVTTKLDDMWEDEE